MCWRFYSCSRRCLCCWKMPGQLTASSVVLAQKKGMHRLARGATTAQS